MIEAVIFDIDGTIVDSVDLHAKAWQRTFSKFGKNILLEAIRSQIGKGADQLLCISLAKSSNSLAKQWNFTAANSLRKSIFQR